jgi:hypothetical protein
MESAFSVAELSALIGSCTALLVAAHQLVAALARSRSVEDEADDTPQSVTYAPSPPKGRRKLSDGA